MSLACRAGTTLARLCSSHQPQSLAARHILKRSRLILFQVCISLYAFRLGALGAGNVRRGTATAVTFT